MDYQVRTGNKRHKLVIDKSADLSQGTRITVGKHEYDVRVLEQTVSGEIKAVAINGKLLSIQVRRRQDGFPYKVIINGEAHPVEIEKVESGRYKPPVAEKQTDNKVLAILPGVIRDILVATGEQVKKGQVLLILEAMKMENEIVAHKNGVVTKINVNKDQLVAKGSILLEISD